MPVTAEVTPEETRDSEELPARPEFDENPAIIDAHRIFLLTLVSATIFIAAVVSFIL